MSNRKKRNYSFKTRCLKRYSRRTEKCSNLSNSNVTFQNILQNNIAKSLTRNYAVKDAEEEEPLYRKYSRMKRELKMREENLKEELETVRGALRKSLEERLICSKEKLSQMSIKKVYVTQRTTEFSEHDLICKRSPNLKLNASLCSDEHVVITNNTVSVQCMRESDNWYKTTIDGVCVFVKAEDSRNFEIETEYPCGSIKTHIMHKSSGNIEIVTDLEDYTEKPVQIVKSELHSAVPRLVLPPTSISSSSIMMKKTVPEKKLEISITEPKEQAPMKEKKTSNVFESVSKILQKLNDSIAYALDQINKNISKALDSLNQNIKMALTVVVRDEIRKVVTEHFSDKKTLISTSTSHNNLRLTDDKEVNVNINEAVPDSSFNENLAEETNTFTCSTTYTVSSYVSNKIIENCDQHLTKQNSAIQTVGVRGSMERATQLTLDRSVDLRPEKEQRALVVKTTSFNVTPPKPKQLFENAASADLRTGMELVYDIQNEVESKSIVTSKRKVRSTKLTKAANQEKVDLYGITIDREVAIRSERFLTDGDASERNDPGVFLESNASSKSSFRSSKFDEKSRKDLRQLRPLPNAEYLMFQFQSTHCLPVINREEILTHTKHESYTNPLTQPTPESKCDVPQNVNSEMHSKADYSVKESVKTNQSIPNSTFSTASSSVVTQALTEGTRVIIDNEDVEQLGSDHTDDTYVTSNAYCASQKSAHDEPAPKPKSKFISGSSGSEMQDYLFNKRRRFTKSKSNRCSQSSISMNGKVHKPTVSNILRKNNALYIRQQPEGCNDIVTPIDIGNQAKTKIPKISSYDCFQSIHAEYCKRKQRRAVQHIPGIDFENQLENFEQHEQEIGKFEEKIKAAGKWTEENRKLARLNRIQQKNCFEVTLSGLQRALDSLKTKLDQTDGKIKMVAVSDKCCSEQLDDKQPPTHIPRRRNIFIGADPSAALHEQKSDAQTENSLEAKKDTAAQKLTHAKLEDKKNVKKSDPKKKQGMAPTNMKPVQTKRRSTALTISNVASNTKIHNKNSLSDELSCLRNCERELKQFLLPKKNVTPTTNSLRRSTPYLQLNCSKREDAFVRKKEAKGKGGAFRSYTETAMKSSTMPKLEIQQRRIEKKKQ